MTDLTTVPQSESLLDRWSVSRDLWPGGTLEFWHGIEAPRPDRVFWPESAEQVAEVLRAASDQCRTVVPYGLGSGVCGGARGRERSWVVDTKRLNTIHRLDEERWTVTAGAGVNGEQLERALAQRGFTLGHSPSSISCSSVGGWAAARSAGQFSSKYGVFEDMVLGLTVATPAEGVLRLGTHGGDDPSLMPLILGSEGTLGVITEVTMRIWRAPESRWLRGYRFRSVEDAVQAMRELMQAELWPSVVRLYDPVDTRIGGKTKPKSDTKSDSVAWYRRALKRVGSLDPIKRRSLALPLALPGLVNRLLDGLASGCLLIVGWEGRPAVVEALSTSGRAILEERGEDLGSEPGERWFKSRHAVSYKLMPIFEKGGFADTMEVACRWSDLVPTYDAVRAAVQPHAVVLAHMSHVYPEGGSIYFSFAGRGSQEVYERVWSAAQEAVLASGATVTHHHGVGQLKARWASQEVGAAVQGWRALKSRLDPNDVMNPGRLFVPVPPKDAGPDPALGEHDGLLRVSTEGSLDERREAAAASGRSVMFPWETLPAPVRWRRSHWQIGWTEVAGRVGAVQCRLGRGPRSAAGPDLRPWLASQGPTRCTIAVVPEGRRWMGTARCDRPWAVAVELLRSDLRPAVLAVVDGWLRVGFRGPSAAALGALASRWVPGGLAVREWEDHPLASGELEFCDLDDADVVGVTAQGALKRGPS